MILLDNIIFELQPYGGVTSVWSSVLKCAFELIPDNLQLLSHDKLDNHPMISLAPDKIVRHKEKNINFMRLRRYCDVACDKNVKIFHSSYFRLAKNKEIKNIVTVHDFIYEKYDSGLSRLVHLTQKKRALKNAAAIICVSENTRKDLFEYHPWLKREIVYVVHNGVSQGFSPITKSEEKQLPYLLYVGGRNIKYKNFRAVLSLLASSVASKMNLQLKVVGGGTFKKYEHKIIEKLGLKEKVTREGYIRESSLNQLYNGAYAFIYPSFYEGFGIPPLEAMAAACPVICSNRASIPEIVGDAGLLFDPNDLTQAEVYLQKLKNPGFRQNIIIKGLMRASAFSWEKTGNKTVEIYKKLLEEV